VTATDERPVEDLPTFRTTDPRTGEVLATLSEHGPAEVAAAVERARAAFVPWSRLTFDERLDHVLAVRDLMLDRVDGVVDVICSETGKLDTEAVTAELLATCELIEHYRKHGAKALRAEKVPVGALLPHKRAWRTYEPMGVVGVISPWNYPLTLSMTPVVSALLAAGPSILSASRLWITIGAPDSSKASRWRRTTCSSPSERTTRCETPRSRRSTPRTQTPLGIPRRAGGGTSRRAGWEIDLRDNS